VACKDYEQLIDKYLEGLVTKEEKLDLEKHMEMCPDCRKEVFELRQIIKAANSLEQIDLPPEFAPSLMEKLRSISPEQKEFEKIPGFIGFIKNIPGLIYSFYYRNKRASIAVMGIFIIGIFIATIYNPANVNYMSFDTQSTKDEAASEAGPSAEEPQMMSSRAMMYNHDMAEGESIDGGYGLGGVDHKISIQSTEARSEKIIKNADLSIYVEDFDDKVDDIINLVNDLGGYIENSEIQGANSADSSRRAYMALRIPQAKLTDALDMFKNMGRVRSQRLSGENITDVYYDTDARIRNLRQQEQRLLEILQMAKNVDEVLRIENELNRVRTEIDLLTGQITAWDKMVEMSLVNLNLIEQEPSKERLGTVTLGELAQRAKEGFIAVINLCVNMLATLAEVLGAIIPLAIIFGVLYKVISLVISKIKNRTKKN
jgi:hypothetical protein